MSITGLVNRQYLLAARPQGLVKESDFRLAEGRTPQPGDGQCLVRVCYMGLEPAMRGWMENRGDYITPLAIGDVMRGFGAGVVVASRNPDWPVGSRVTGSLGWQEYVLTDGREPELTAIAEGVAMPTALHLFGLTGMTAWFGMKYIGHPSKGQTAVISAAAGATGSVAAQLARRAGCRVVGLAGSEVKRRWLLEELGLDAAVDYHGDDFSRRLRAACPDGIDLYWDNVGGRVLNTALGQLAMHARVVLCGGISGYNATEAQAGPGNYFNLIFRRARMEGFIVLDYADEMPDAAVEMKRMFDRGELMAAFTAIDGFEQLPAALIRLFNGDNLGKQLVRLADEQTLNRSY